MTGNGRAMMWAIQHSLVCRKGEKDTPDSPSHLKPTLIVRGSPLFITNIEGTPGERRPFLYTTDLRDAAAYQRRDFIIWSRQQRPLTPSWHNTCSGLVNNRVSPWTINCVKIAFGGHSVVPVSKTCVDQPPAPTWGWEKDWRVGGGRADVDGSCWQVERPARPTFPSPPILLLAIQSSLARRLERTEEVYQRFSGKPPDPEFEHNLTVISSLVYCESDVLNHAATEAGFPQCCTSSYLKTCVCKGLGGPVFATLDSQFPSFSLTFSPVSPVIFTRAVHPTEIRTSIYPFSAVELNTTSALANYTTEAENEEWGAVEEQPFSGRFYWYHIAIRAYHDNDTFNSSAIQVQRSGRYFSVEGCKMRTRDQIFDTSSRGRHHIGKGILCDEGVWQRPSTESERERLATFSKGLSSLMCHLKRTTVEIVDTEDTPLSMSANGWRPVIPSSPNYKHRQFGGSSHPVLGKLQAHMEAAEKAKKEVGAATAESSKVEVFAPAPPSLLGSFSLVGQATARGRDNPDKNKVTEQEDRLPEGRIVYSAHLVPPPLQPSTPTGATRGQQAARYQDAEEQRQTYFIQPPSSKDSQSYFDKYPQLKQPSGVFPPLEHSSFSTQYQNNYFPSSHQSANVNLGQSSSGYKEPKPGFYLQAGLSSLGNQQDFKIIPDFKSLPDFKTSPESIQYFKDYSNTNANTYLSQSFNRPNQDSVYNIPPEKTFGDGTEVEKQVYYVKHINPNNYAVSDDQKDKLVYPRPQKSPSEVEIIHGSGPQLTFYSTPPPEEYKYDSQKIVNHVREDSRQPIIGLGGLSSFYSTTPTPTPLDLYLSPSPSSAHNKPLPTNSLSDYSSTLQPSQEELNPLQFLTAPGVPMHSPGDRGRITRPYFREERPVQYESGSNTNTKTVVNKQIQPMFDPLKIPSATDVEEGQHIFLPTIPPSGQNFLQKPKYRDGITLPPAESNEVSTQSIRVKETFHHQTEYATEYENDVATASPTKAFLNPIENENASTKPPTKGGQRPYYPTRRPINKRPRPVQKNQEEIIPDVQEQDTVQEYRDTTTEPPQTRRPPAPLEDEKYSTEQATAEDIQKYTHTYPSRRPSQGHTFDEIKAHGHETYFESSTKPHRIRRPTTQSTRDGGYKEKHTTSQDTKDDNRRPQRTRKPIPTRVEHEDMSLENHNSNIQIKYNRRPFPQRIENQESKEEQYYIQDYNQDTVRTHTSRRPTTSTWPPQRHEDTQDSDTHGDTRRKRPYGQRKRLPLYQDDGELPQDEEISSQDTDQHRPYNSRRPSSQRGQVSYSNDGNTLKKQEEKPRRRPYTNNSRRPTSQSPRESVEFRNENDSNEGNVQTTRPTYTRTRTSQFDDQNNYETTRQRRTTTQAPFLDSEEQATRFDENNNFYAPSPADDNEINTISSTTTSTTAKPSRRYPSSSKLRNRERYSSRIQAAEHPRVEPEHELEVRELPIVSYPELGDRLPQSHRHTYEINYDSKVSPTQSVDLGEDGHLNLHSSQSKGEYFNRNNNNNEDDLTAHNVNIIPEELEEEYENDEQSRDNPPEEHLENENYDDVTTHVSTTKPTSSITPPTTSSTTSTTTSTTTTTTTTPAPSTTTMITTTSTTMSPPPPTTLPLSSSTPETTTPILATISSNRIRPRIRPGVNSTRPRFSVKDYRQRLNRVNGGNSDDEDSYVSSSDKNEAEVSLLPQRLRYPSRTRGSYSYKNEDTIKNEAITTTTELTRNKYRSKDGLKYTGMRTRTTTTPAPEVDQTTPSEKVNPFKPSTNRYKFGTGKYFSRYHATSPSPLGSNQNETSNDSSSATTPRIVMKPKGVFSAVRRTLPIRTRAENNDTISTSAVVYTLPSYITASPDISNSSLNEASTTESSATQTTSTNKFRRIKPKIDDISSPFLLSFSETTSEQDEHLKNKLTATLTTVETVTPAVITRNTHMREETTTPTAPLGKLTTLEDTMPTSLMEDLVSPSQRVADLTSAATASGYFNSPSPSGRQTNLRITMATEDPILPIEAFFPVWSNKD
uniref:Uncharacterized protein n=1 Tax=Timema shepardi TaxID=629360 RepID=A0A7R9G249_TIMSH|nr:unnamed protein product [Timema shepardi]